MMNTYRVQPGDTPARIAARLTGNPARAIELVAVNRAYKPVVMVGRTMTFGSLHVGEMLYLPPSWHAGLGQQNATSQPQHGGGGPTNQGATPAHKTFTLPGDASRHPSHPHPTAQHVNAANVAVTQSVYGDLGQCRPMSQQGQPGNEAFTGFGSPDYSTFFDLPLGEIYASNEGGVEPHFLRDAQMRPENRRYWVTAYSCEGPGVGQGEPLDGDGLGQAAPTTTPAPSSNTVPIVVGLVSVAAGVGLAYAITRKPKRR